MIRPRLLPTWTRWRAPTRPRGAASGRRCCSTEGAAPSPALELRKAALAPWAGVVKAGLGTETRVQRRLGKVMPPQHLERHAHVLAMRKRARIDLATHEALEVGAVSAHARPPRAAGAS